MHSITRNRGKELFIPDNVDTLADDELSSDNSPSLSLSLAKNAQESVKAKLRKRHSHHPAFNEAVSGVSRRARRYTTRRQNQPVQALRNASVLLEGTMPPILPTSMIPQMPFIHLAFSTGPTFYMLPIALICKPQ